MPVIIVRERRVEHMNAHELILFMMQDSGKRESELSRMLSHDRTYLRSTLKRKGVPRASTYARIADVCGYDLLVRRRSDEYEILIDPFDE